MHTPPSAGQIPHGARVRLKQNGQEIPDVNNKLYKKLLWGTGFVTVAVILTLFIMSQTYIQNLVYHERLNQMEEVTHQMFRSLEDVIDTHWDEVNVQCNYLYYTPLKTDTEFYRYLKKLSELSNYHERQIELIAVDSAGHYYTENGRMGLLRGMKYLESAPQRVSYVSNSLTVDDSRMVFLEQLSTPITLQSGEKEITLRYFGISQSMTQLNDYFRCDAYENNNSVYVLDNNGFKLFNANDTELLKGHNVYTVLSRMSYLHGSSFAEAKEQLDRTGSCYSNAVLDGTEYFYALKQMENAQWTLAFLVPAEYVAVNTQKLVNIVMVIIIVIAMMFSVITVFVGWFLLRQKQQQELQAEKEANLRLEQYNIHLTQVNDELRQAQDIAAEALQSAERASKAKTDFLANMSHEIRTPLNAIVGFSRIISESDNAEERREYYEIVDANNERLLQLINEILDLSKIESGIVEFTYGPVRLHTLCKEIHDAHVFRCPQGVELRFDSPDEALSIHSDKNRIFQVFSNLIGNAFKFTTEGSVSYGYKQEGERVVFYVKDTGLGIEPEKLGRVFQRFAKLNNFAQGTGLGLSICKTIIERLGGEIAVSSEVGTGTTFTFWLPLENVIQDTETGTNSHLPGEAVGTQPPEVLPAKEDTPCPKEETTEKEEDLRATAAGTEKATILIAEDTDSNFDLLNAILGRKYHLVRAKDGMEAVTMYDEVNPDLILMDIKMPNLDGLEATRIIRQLSAEVPIIAQSAYAYEHDRNAAEEAGCNDFISKPIAQEKLKEKIKKWLK